VAELTASIAHEVNQPLSAVVANAGAALRWLEAKPPNLNEVQQALQRIVRDGNRASEVVARIRGLLKDRGAARTEFALEEIIGEIVALTDAEARQRHVLVQLRLEPGLPTVSADRVQLQQVLMNLIMNALEAMADVTDRTRILTIHAERIAPDSLRVAIQDTGPGIDPQHMEHIFEPFRTTKPHGLGLGLSISRSIIEAHRGRLWVSANSGPGVTFQFTLPIRSDGAVVSEVNPHQTFV
jgi:signal transduction histidine kinase